MDLFMLTPQIGLKVTKKDNQTLPILLINHSNAIILQESGTSDRN